MDNDPTLVHLEQGSDEYPTCWTVAWQMLDHKLDIGGTRLTRQARDVTCRRCLHVIGFQRRSA
jgi:hypothetical protein